MTLHVAAGTPKRLASRALAARLYNPQGGLIYQLQAIARGQMLGTTVAVLGDDNQELYGVAVINNQNQIGAYVCPEARGKGWGEKLVRMAMTTRPDQSAHVYALPSEDVPKGLRFWQRCKIEVRDHGYAPVMFAREFEEFTSRGRCLIDRRAAHVSMADYEAMYIQQLFAPDTTDEEDGIRGKLAYMFETKVAPFDVVLYHYGKRFESCGIIAEMPRQIEGDSRTVVELQLFVKDEYRKQGLGQEIITRAQSLYPDRKLFGYHTPLSARLFERNGIEDLRSLS